MKVFIIGDVKTAEKTHSASKFFDSAEEELIEAGYSVFSPLWLYEGADWEDSDHMTICTAALSCCDAVFQIPGWENSREARALHDYACSHKKYILMSDGYGTFTQLRLGR